MKNIAILILLSLAACQEPDEPTACEVWAETTCTKSAECDGADHASLPNEHAECVEYLSGYCAQVIVPNDNRDAAEICAAVNEEHSCYYWRHTETSDCDPYNW